MQRENGFKGRVVVKFGHQATKKKWVENIEIYRKFRVINKYVSFMDILNETKIWFTLQIIYKNSYSYSIDRKKIEFISIKKNEYDTTDTYCMCCVDTPQWTSLLCTETGQRPPFIPLIVRMKLHVSFTYRIWYHHTTCVPQY